MVGGSADFEGWSSVGCSEGEDDVVERGENRSMVRCQQFVGMFVRVVVKSVLLSSVRDRI